ncbi:hypothetical protein AAZX31_19G015600 [Glycine max]|uniref:DUF4408 domain-containing protein n=2 Tax=Glycine subgen. Soja TaxID=1462606 RepID=I1N602_SOYBN|nr:uncharacterized protein LOC100306529 [Glycine max]XP_028217763.1 uncharacterized protein LOC114399747 [Glycine soja]KAG4911574.1 hypothetical protein JHK86_052007 [Glycine max]KAG5084783.1 hypothetical protein JHK82_052180 [Glycine max]KAH1075979.1 hypothetical protein GYH30_051736 [Glycine max]KAH1192560.1 hypothetical protein GmHk_19G053765 [Glycine max]KHN34177.1 hypothetical protein glysoja_033370 [Glycine soja]|eukprot:NP_001236335.2 uncharacterized protein LOC100306529 [Glycine max]
MEMKREIITKEEEHKEDSMHTIVFTAGTFLLMVCLKHFLVEQWRAWVFLILNVILLAILFMSMRPAKLEDHSSGSEISVEEVKSDNNKLEKKRSRETEEGKDCYTKQCCSSTSSSTYVHVENEKEEDEEEEEEEEEQVPVLSKEELNERVEAFIAMFRQHLISDVKQAENFSLHKIEVSCC